MADTSLLQPEPWCVLKDYEKHFPNINCAILPASRYRMRFQLCMHLGVTRSHDIYLIRARGGWRNLYKGTTAPCLALRGGEMMKLPGKESTVSTSKHLQGRSQHHCVSVSTTPVQVTFSRSYKTYKPWHSTKLTPGSSAEPSLLHQGLQAICGPWNSGTYADLPCLQLLSCNKGMP